MIEEKPNNEANESNLAKQDELKQVEAQNPAKKAEKVEQPVDEIKTEQPKKSFKQVILGFISFIIVIISLAYVFVLWSLLEGGVANPFFSMLGIKPEELKLLLLTITNSLFGAVALIFILSTLVKFFQWMMSSAESAYKKIYLKKTGVQFFILLVIVAIWIGLYIVISRAEVSPIEQTNSESFIITSPTNVIGLTAPVSVNFDIGTNLYKRIPAKFVKQIEWDLNADDVYGDASGPVITHRFLNHGKDNGKFLIKVKVVYVSPSSSEEKEYLDEREVIIANEAVTAVLDTNVSEGSIPLTVKFSAENSVDPDGSIIQYEWDLDGDGEYEIRGDDKEKVEKVYTKIGEYKVSLRVTGQNNDYAVISKQINAIAADEKIRAKISSENASFQGAVPLTIELDGSQSYTKMDSIVKYEWFVEGDEETYLGRTLKRTFDTPGEYEVTLVVENKNGERDKETQKIVVYEKKNVVITSSVKKNEAGNIQGVMPLRVLFDSADSEIPRAIEWKWDFENDGIYDEFAQKIEHVFRRPGEYQVKLTIVDDKNKEYSTLQKVVVDKQGVIAKISALPVAGEVPLGVEFDGSGSSTSAGEIIDYIWEFPGEQPIHDDSKISREFRAIGTFKVKLTVLTSKGERQSDEILISVRGQSLQAYFDVSAEQGEAPLLLQFNSQKSKGNITEYYWDFGDGQESYLNNPEHLYKVPGEYTVKLRVMDNRNIYSETHKKIVVEKPAKNE